MASTYSPLKIELIATGEQSGIWGATTNTNLGTAIEEAITGSADVAFSSADVTVTLTDTNAAQTARNLRLNLTGTSGGARNLILGSGCQIEKLYLINNGLADAVTVKNTSGTGIAVPAGKTMFVYNNGTNVVDATTHLSSLTTGTLSASGATTFTAGTASTSTTTGTAVITGGLGVSGRINAANFDGIVGANTAAAGTFTSLSDSGNLTFTGTGNRITGDFNNATLTNRVLFQTSTTNANTVIGVITNGTGASSQLALYASSDPSNAAWLQVGAGANSGTEHRIAGTQTGTGTYLPLTMHTGGSERLRIDTSGNVGIGTSSPACRLDLNRGSAGLLANFTDGVNTNFQIETASLLATIGPSAGSTGMAFKTGNTERMRITSSGNVGIATTSPTSGLEVYRATSTTGSLTDASLMLSTTATTGRKVSIGFGLGGGVANTCAANIGYDVTNGAGAGLGDIYFSTRSTTADSTPTERMRIDSSGNVGIGTSSPVFASGGGLSVYNAGAARIKLGDSTSGIGSLDGFELIYDDDAYVFNRENTAIIFGTNGAERMRITSGGSLLVGTTNGAPAQNNVAGFCAGADGITEVSASSTNPLYVNRAGNDGGLVSLRQAGTQEGDISVSGTTVSYNGGHLSRWSQLPDGSKDDTILKGTVLTNLDDMCVWEKDGVVADNEQLNKMKVSDVEGDTNVAGVFVNWTIDADYGVDDMNVAMTGDMIIRIADGVVVQKGDLLMSAGDGTAKPQGDDIVRSKTVAKVTSNHVTCTYADGSYCVPCVLMAC